MSQTMERYYSHRAAEYERIYDKPERQHELEWLRHRVPEIFSGRDVLEVACGTGYWTQFIAPVAARVLAVDAAEATLRIARQRVASGQAEFVSGDAYALPASAEGFQAGFAGFWFSHVSKTRVRAFLRGWHAALSPGARVVLLDNRFVAGSSTPIAERDAEGNTYQSRRLDDGSSHRVLKNFPTEAELREATAGLARDVRLREWRHYWALEYAVAAP